jgi:RNA polymerase-binding transcription factor DksA
MTLVAEKIPTTREPDSASTSAPAPPVGRSPRWRSVLEARWRARLEEMTELSVAYHDAAAAPALSASKDETPPAKQRLRRLLRQAVTARRALADTEDALTRLADGRYGRCEDCSSALPHGLLVLEPETRYCPRCVPQPAGGKSRHDGQVLAASPVA